MFDKLKFCERLKEARIAKGFKNQKNFANAAGIAVQSVNCYELGKRIPDAETLYKLASCLECSCDWLLGITENTKPDNALISQRTGLSDDAIQALQERYEDEKYKAYNLITNAVIASDYFWKIVESLTYALEELERVKHDYDGYKNLDRDYLRRMADEHKKSTLGRVEYEFVKHMAELYVEIVSSFSEEYGDILLRMLDEQCDRIRISVVRPLLESFDRMQGSDKEHVHDED